MLIYLMCDCLPGTGGIEFSGPKQVINVNTGNISMPTSSVYLPCLSSQFVIWNNYNAERRPASDAVHRAVTVKAGTGRGVPLKVYEPSNQTNFQDKGFFKVAINLWCRPIK